MLLVEEAYRSGRLLIDFSSYGHLHFNLSLICVHVAGLFGEVTQQLMCQILRSVTLAFGAATIACTGLLALRTFGTLAAAVAPLLVATALCFLEQSTLSHPDTLQVFFLTLGLLFCTLMAEQGRWSWLTLASVCAGLAFASKYSGAFLLPVIWLVGAATFRAEGAPRYATLLRAKVLAVGLIAIALALVLTPEVATRTLKVDFGAGGGMLYGASRLQYFQTARLAAGAAGLACLVLASLGNLWRRVRASARLSSTARVVLRSFACFAITFALASPGSLRRLSFVKGILVESLHTGFGQDMRASANPLEWFGVLFSQDLLDVALAPLLLASLALALRAGFVQPPRKSARAAAVAWLLVLGYLGYLFLRVRHREPHYVLPVLPLLAILSVHPLAEWMRQAARSRWPRAARGLAACAVAALLAWTIPVAAQRALSFKRELLTQAETKDAVLAGRWLRSAFPPATRILYDRFSYVPPEFTDIRDTDWAGTEQRLLDFDPDVVVVNNWIAYKFEDAAQAADYSLGEEAFLESWRYYEGLKNGLWGARLVRDFRTVRVYARE